MGKGSKQQLDGKVAAGKKMNEVIAYEVLKKWKESETIGIRNIDNRLIRSAPGLGGSPSAGLTVR